MSVQQAPFVAAAMHTAGCLAHQHPQPDERPSLTPAVMLPASSYSVVPPVAPWP